MRKRLLVLMYSANPCYLSLCLADDPNVSECGVIINERSGDWTAPNMSGSGRPREKYSIGEARPASLNCKWGVIGVFDRYNMEHLKAMVTAAGDASRGNGHPL